jgi:TPP-dependent pyruvate/acetoin dehydrogenase alpha subunit
MTPVTYSQAFAQAMREEMVLKARATVQDAIAFADESPLPDPADATRDVTALELGLGNAR